MLSTFWTLASLGAGFGQVLLMDADLRGGNYPAGRKSAVYREVLERLRAILGVHSASASDPAPMCGCGIDKELVIEGYAAGATVNLIRVSERYFETLGITVFAGRAFNC